MSKKILIVDDDINQLTILSTYLKKYDYKIEAANNAIVGFKRYKEQKQTIGLIVTDMQMPMMTGEEFIKNIHDINSEVPIIILSGTGFDFRHLESISNVKEILQKPINYSSFHTIVDKHFSDQKTP